MHTSSITTVRDCKRSIIIWLALACLLVFAMVVLGGAVRLTGSGLSMVEWQPILGVLPPLNEIKWAEAFAKYKAYPEYQIKNKGMSLHEFKFIYYMEYFHRLLGRVLGLVFFIPFMVFLYKRCLSKRLTGHLLVLFVLGGLQGLMGWYMVKSGLVDNPHVSPYRLTAHMLIAFIIFIYFIRLIVDLSMSPFERNAQYPYRFCVFILGLMLLMIASGGLVAGTKAGFIYNTFPSMHGQYLPDTLLALSPWWLNIFENPVMVQWQHRLLALIVLICTTTLIIKLYKHSALRASAMLLALALLLQLCIGVLTLIYQVPLYLGVLHQAGALVLIAVQATILFRLKPLRLA